MSTWLDLIFGKHRTCVREKWSQRPHLRPDADERAPL